MNRNILYNRFGGFGFGFPFLPFIGGLAVGSLLAPRPYYPPPYPYYPPYQPYQNQYYFR
ncbi:hypothetical protein [Sutcliffiella rhizosphaerae]|uniref:Spore coat protein n=1 Tax=Sutcliffiella rhizosphaerae TaxID=2880967 RepID=A0ABN8AB50_9BACI|nr:hypothetical protein [Sutcliffiella rhizosphaerae]CAG9619915.1 hypothetical protein BACCIP111883_00683 [Sutcliffiella rhizosphaerae]